MADVLSDKVAKAAADHLMAADPILAPVIASNGLCTIRPHKNYYWELIDAIISQQLSVKAAANIERRFQELFGSESPPPVAILQKSVDELRSVGLSRAKAGYIRDLAGHILNGRIVFEVFDNLTNAEIISELTAVRGIGEWTAQMFLMFCMGRADILATGDLGIRNAVKKLYAMEILPTPRQVKELSISRRWHPYETVACWYLWKSSDNLPG
jgi:DNA-3-methyladenine glycosylase II